MGRRLADQRHIVFTVGCEGWAFPLVTVEDYPHVSLAADHARDWSFVRAEPLEHLVDGPRVAREFPSIDVKNRFKKRPRNRGCGESFSAPRETLSPQPRLRGRFLYLFFTSILGNSRATRGPSTRCSSGSARMNDQSRA